MLTDDEAKRNIAANVTKLRGERSRYWLAKSLGVAPIQVTRIEEARHLPGSGVLARLAEILEVSTDFLLENHGPNARQKKSRRSA